MNFEPIGLFHSRSVYKFDAPRQGLYDGASGFIVLDKHKNFEAALDDIDGFERLWIIFSFHLNSNWKPKTSPPVAPENRRFGVFATRSPYRPNMIGLSCVKLANRSGLTLNLEETDLLDGTPILDIKPYIPEIDSFPNAAAGWRDNVKKDAYKVIFTEPAINKAHFIGTHSEVEIENFCRIQLAYDPLSDKRKRIEKISGSLYSIGCRTWKIFYSCDNTAKTVTVSDVFSNYTADELRENTPDKYADKDVHRLFNTFFHAPETAR